MGRKKTEVLEALVELVEEKKVKKSSKKKEEPVLVPVVDNLKYNGFEKDQMVEIPIENDLERISSIYRIGSIGVENGRYYAMMNRLTVTGIVDKRYKQIKKYFDENNICKVNELHKGDKIFLDKRGAISWELNDYTGALKKNFFYTVKSMRCDRGIVYVELDEAGTLLHPNHFVKKEE